MDTVIVGMKALRDKPAAEKGGPGSGNFGHAGIPGQQGGSLPSGIGATGFGSEEENAHAARTLSRDMSSVLNGDLRGIMSANGLQTHLVRGDIADHPDVPVDNREGIRGADAAFVPEGKNGPLLLLNDRSMDLKPIVAHEIGHIIDHSDPSRNFAITKINRQSMGKEFFEAYDGEKGALSRLARSDPREGFAEMFRTYWDDPGRFHKIAPKSAKYVDKVLAEGGLTIGQVFRGRRFEKAQDSPPEPLRDATRLLEGEIGHIIPSEKALPEERGTAPTRWFENNFQDWFPESGKGRYVLQHHAFVPEELKDADYRRVIGMKGLGIHGDLRMDRGKGPEDERLLGFTIFLGNTDKLRQGWTEWGLKPDDALQGEWKAPEPVAWLDVGRPPESVEPGESGARGKTDVWGRFFAVDWGEFEVGVIREHSFEVFFDGKLLKGRYNIVYAEIGGERKWLFKRPEDQKPQAEDLNLDATVAELKGKGQKFLVVGMPGAGKPRLIDTGKYKPADETEKADGVQEWSCPSCSHLVWGVELGIEACPNCEVPVEEKGGPGSGNWGHEGVPGEQGGSAAGGFGLGAQAEEKIGIDARQIYTSTRLTPFQIKVLGESNLSPIQRASLEDIEGHLRRVAVASMESGVDLDYQKFAFGTSHEVLMEAAKRKQKAWNQRAGVRALEAKYGHEAADRIVFRHSGRHIRKEDGSTHFVPIAKVDEEKRLVTGPVLIPAPFVDAQNDFITAEEIERCAHEWAMTPRFSFGLDLQHQRKLKPAEVQVVESWILKEAWKTEQMDYPVGSWMLTVKVHSDEVWKQVKSGELTGFSIKGVAYRKGQ